MLKNITLSAEARIIHQARARALAEKKSLNVVFRQWLIQYARGEMHPVDYENVMKQLKHIKAGKRFSREDLNAR